MLKTLLIERVKSMLRQYYSERRYGVVKEFIYEASGGDPTTKRGNNECREINLVDWSHELADSVQSFSDEQLVDLITLVSRRYAAQM